MTKKLLVQGCKAEIAFDHNKQRLSVKVTKAGHTIVETYDNDLQTILTAEQLEALLRKALAIKLARQP
jgi:hypothetical protein